ncbi:MAG: CBS domain-containing protein [Gallionellaceae bacterium]|jgi:CBS domain-containing protein
MKKNDSVTKIMSTNVAVIQEGRPLSEVRKIMCDLDIHHVPIVSGAKLVGLVSFTDMMKINLVVNGADERSIGAIIDQQFKISDVMSNQLTTIKNTETIRQAAELLIKGHFHSLPVIDSADNIVGIVTSTDLIKYLNEQY